MAEPQEKPKFNPPIPKPTPTSQGFWDAANRGKLAIQYDPVSRSYQFWPRTISGRTGKRNLQWKEVSGLGTLYSYTITYVPVPGFEAITPYPLGLVELDEGVRIAANLINVRNEDVKIGMRVKVAFQRRSPEINYFAFEPA